MIIDLHTHAHPLKALAEEAQRRNLDLNPLTGEDVQKIVVDAMATPRELVGQAQRYAKP